MLIIRRSKLYYTASGTVTPVGGRPVRRLREEIIYYEVSHFVILSSVLSPLHPIILLGTLWSTPHVNFVVL